MLITFNCTTFWIFKNLKKITLIEIIKKIELHFYFVSFCWTTKVFEWLLLELWHWLVSTSSDASPPSHVTNRNFKLPMTLSCNNICTLHEFDETDRKKKKKRNNSISEYRNQILLSIVFILLYRFFFLSFWNVLCFVSSRVQTVSNTKSMGPKIYIFAGGLKLYTVDIFIPN